MRKAMLFALMLTLLLTACGGEEKDPVGELQRQYAAVTAATMEADVICHYAGELRTYTLLCAYTPAESTVTVLAPANLSGISATVADGKLHLNYEDISLDAGGYSAAAISPVAALPRLMAAAGSGYLTEQSEETVGERSCLRLACDLPDDKETVYTTWFDQETLLPLRSEITADGEMVFEDRRLGYGVNDVAIIPPMVPHSNVSEGGFTNIHINLADAALSHTEPMIVRADSNGFLLDAFKAAFYYYSEASGGRALLPLYAYVLLEVVTWGLNLWSVCYVYVWLILAGAAWLLRRMESPLGWAALSGGFLSWRQLR